VKQTLFFTEYLLDFGQYGFFGLIPMFFIFLC